MPEAGTNRMSVHSRCGQYVGRQIHRGEPGLPVLMETEVLFVPPVPCQGVNSDFRHTGWHIPFRDCASGTGQQPSPVASEAVPGNLHPERENHVLPPDETGRTDLNRKRNC